ncbi:MAG: MFS transporter [Pseudomonadota bacterium]
MAQAIKSARSLGAITSDLSSLIRAFLAIFCAGALYGWSALAPSLQSRFDTSTAEVGFVFSIAIVSFTVAVLVAPRLVKRFNEVAVMGVSALLATVWVGLAAVAWSFPMFLLCFSLGFGFASGSIYSTALRVGASGARPWLTTPMMVAGFGLGGVVFSAIWTTLVARDWGISALAVLAVALFLTALFRFIPRGAVHRASDAVEINRPETPPAFQRPTVILWGIFALGSFSGLMVLGLAGSVLEQAEAGVALTAFVLAGVAMGNTLGRFSAALTRGASPTVALVASVALNLAGLGLALGNTAPLWVGLSLITIALGYGLMASAVPLATSYVFGAERFQAAFGIIFTAWGLSGFAAPWLAGRLFDLSGSFTPGFTVAIIMTLGTLPLIFLLDRARP